MNSVVVPNNFAAVSTRFAQSIPQDDFSAGVQTSYGILGYRGKVWSLRYGGEEKPLMRPEGDGPRNSVEVVVLKASTMIAKIFYEAGYVDGSTSPPDCYSTNGVVPDADSQKKQSATCASCPQNVWGSRITTAGKKGKNCSDSKRLAVVPLDDLTNEAAGGPLLLRVPAASLQDLATFGKTMQSLGYPYYSIGIRIGFNVEESYPKFEFGAIRPLTDAEADKVLAMREDNVVSRILSEDTFQAGAGVESAVPEKTVFEQPPAAAVDAVAAAKAAAAKITADKPAAATRPAAAKPVAAKPAAAPASKREYPKPAAIAAPVQEAEPVEEAEEEVVDEASDFESALDDQLEALMNK